MERTRHQLVCLCAVTNSVKLNPSAPPSATVKISVSFEYRRCFASGDRSHRELRKFEPIDIDSAIHSQRMHSFLQVRRTPTENVVRRALIDRVNQMKFIDDCGFFYALVPPFTERLF